MSTFEQHSSALLDSPTFSFLHGGPDDPLTSTCSICYQALHWDTTVTEAEDPIQLQCGHIFGLSCIQTWIAFSVTCPTCPMCRTEIDSKDAYTASSWHYPVEDEMFSTCVTRVDADDHFDARGDFIVPSMTTYRFEEDMWLALAYEEVNALCASRNRRFSAYDEDAIESARCRKRLRHAESFSPDSYHLYSTDIEDESFNDLMNRHVEWIDCTPSIEDANDEFAVSYYDVLAC